MKNTLKFAITAALLGSAPFASAEVDCVKLSQAVKAAVAADSSRVLDIVRQNIAADESCACEVVKAAIIASNASQKDVAKIVDAAILEAPSQLRIIVQCAIATAPEAASAVNAIAEKYDAAGGEGYSAKGGLDDSKNVVVPPASDFNPLDYPFDNINDPIEKDFYWQPGFFFPDPDDDPNATDLLDDDFEFGPSVSLD